MHPPSERHLVRFRRRLESFAIKPRRDKSVDRVARPGAVVGHFGQRRPHGRVERPMFACVFVPYVAAVASGQTAPWSIQAFKIAIWSAVNGSPFLRHPADRFGGPFDRLNQQALAAFAWAESADPDRPLSLPRPRIQPQPRFLFLRAMAFVASRRENWRDLFFEVDFPIRRRVGLLADDSRQSHASEKSAHPKHVISMRTFSSWG